MRTKGEIFRSNISFIRLYLAESRGANFAIKRDLSDEVRKRYFVFLERLASVFDSGMKNERFKDRSPAHIKLAVALDSVVNSFLLLWLDAPERNPYPEDPDAILDIFFKGLIDP